MTINEFVEKYNGKYVEVAGSANALNQCVDLANQYIREVLGFPIIEWTNAKDFPSKADGRYDWVQNSPTAVPNEGDLVIWDGTYGHIAIFIEGDVNRFRSFDQNYPSGSPCRIVDHGYTNVKGWMRPKNTQASEIDALRVERDRNWNYFTGLCDVMGVSHSFDIAKAELEKLIKLEDALRSKEKSLEEANSKIRGLEQALNDLRIKHEELKTDNSILNNQFEAQKQMIDDQGRQISDLSKSLQSLKNEANSEKSGYAQIWEGIQTLLGWR